MVDGNPPSIMGRGAVGHGHIVTNGTSEEERLHPVCNVPLRQLCAAAVHSGSTSYMGGFGSRFGSLGTSGALSIFGTGNRAELGTRVPLHTPALVPRGVCQGQPRALPLYGSTNEKPLCANPQSIKRLETWAAQHGDRSERG